MNFVITSKSLFFKSEAFPLGSVPPYARHGQLALFVNFPIDLIFGILIPITTKYNVICEASL